MSSIFIYGNTFEKVYSIFILISNSTTLILSLLLIITNIVKENNKNISLMLSINYQIGVVCILHSISFILYPFNNKEDTTIVTIEGTLAIISSLVIINLVGSLLIFEYVLLKEEIRKKYSLSIQLSSTWVLPIIFGIAYYLFGNITPEINMIGWIQNEKVLDAIFFILYVLLMAVCFIYLFKVRFEMKKLTKDNSSAKSSKSYKKLMSSIKIYLIALISCVVVVVLNLISIIFGHGKNSGDTSNSISIETKYIGSVIEIILVFYFCWFCGYEGTKRKMFLELFCCKKVEKEEGENINIGLILNEEDEDEEEE